VPSRRWLAAAALAFLALGAVLVRDPGSAYRHSDMFQFWAAPRLLLEGRDPYDVTDWAGIYEREARHPVATPPPPARHIYPLWSAVPLLPLAALPFDAAAPIWLAAQVVAVALAVRALAGVFALRRRDRFVLYGLAASFQPVWLIAGGGNATGFVLAAFVAALALAPRRPRAAGAALALVALKPHPLFLGVPALIGATGGPGRARLVAAAAAVFALLLVVTVPLGPDWPAKWADAAIARQLTPTGSNATVWTIGRVLPGAPLIAPLLAAAACAGFALWWRRGRPGPAVMVAGSVALSLFLTPHGWSYDHILLLIPLAATLAGVGSLEGARRLAALTAVAALTTLLPWILYAVAIARQGEEWSALTPLAFFATLVASVPRTARPWHDAS
jgi:hypothetical protein